MHSDLQAEIVVHIKYLPAKLMQTRAISAHIIGSVTSASSQVTDCMR